MLHGLRPCDDTHDTSSRQFDRLCHQREKSRAWNGRHPSVREVENSLGDRHWRRSRTRDHLPRSLRDYEWEWNQSHRQSKIPASGSVHKTMVMDTHQLPR